ncbi:SDR family NAD(P)-dependent oxidoreductase [Actinoplanes sp. L3-i22]|uniref:SDR family NAD(P)-dependent oxidoreductase n=1 Tax=Actinoplanes sp. L3-i22 TaxID=2836373 RepID=UPI001C759D4F|nr:SDR family NAD(P)-dependent oxidoreductase [Actinoplanes sp. L3-i22]BCY09221.1 short-chain dehydrogenase [Actinoplanes sp. L3-i22]
MSNTMSGVVAVVTGSSRGVGKGIAVELGRRGATVYVTGRTVTPGSHPLPGTVGQTADEITAAGGRGIAVAVDHADDQQVRALFDRVADEQGHLDLLVNNASILAADATEPPPFWTKGLQAADQITVGLRSAYVSTHLAAGLLLKSARGLVVNISYYGSVSYHLDPAYGATKAGLDKMSWDMAQDFGAYGVAVVSLWPGPTSTERALALRPDLGDGQDRANTSETPAFTGMVIASLYRDPDLMAHSGQVVIGAEAALAYGFADVNGKQPPSRRAQLGSPNSYPGGSHARGWSSPASR